MTPMKRFIRRRKRDNSGQGITEYGAIIAFVAVLISITFFVSKGRLAPAVSAAFSQIANQVNLLSSYAS